MIEIIKKEKTLSLALSSGDLLYDSGIGMYGILIKQDTYKQICATYNVMLLNTDTEQAELYFPEPTSITDILEFGFNLVSKKGNYNIKIEYS